MKLHSLLLTMSCAGLVCAERMPRIFCSDLENGPASGGEGGNGAFVTLYGANFGADRGSSTVTLNGAPIAAYRVWKDSKITIQIGPKASTGNFVVKTAAGESNPVPFTVRPGKILFVANNGNNGNSGRFNAPWKTIQHAVDKMEPGDVTYVMNGVVETRPGSSDSSVTIRTSGKSGMPLALVAYPGAVAGVGTTGSGTCYSTDCIEGIVTAKNGQGYSYWVIAGLTLRGNNNALAIVGGHGEQCMHWRVVGNDMTCPYGDGQGACFDTSNASHIALYANNVHHAGQPGAKMQEYYQGVYFSTDSNHIDMAWNTVSHVAGCRAVQIHSSRLGNGGPQDPTGQPQYDIRIRDNIIHDSACDGIVLATIDPSKGKIEVYNNVIYRTGAGPRPRSGSGNFSCIFAPGTTYPLRQPGGGVVEIYNNTMFDCGAVKNPRNSNAVQNGGANPNLRLRLRNNIIVQPPGQTYIDADGPMEGSHNLFAGNGSTPRAPKLGLTNSLNVNPEFLDPSKFDFRLSATSPARGKGAETGIQIDLQGCGRDAGQPLSIGALQCPPK